MNSTRKCHVGFRDAGGNFQSSIEKSETNVPVNANVVNVVSFVKYDHSVTRHFLAHYLNSIFFTARQFSARFAALPSSLAEKYFFCNATILCPQPIQANCVKKQQPKTELGRNTIFHNSTLAHISSYLCNFGIKKIVVGVDNNVGLLDCISN